MEKHTMNAKTIGTIAGLTLLGVATGIASGAYRLVETVPGADVDVGAAGNSFQIPFTTNETVTGIGLTCLWTAVVADTENGIAPWSLDLNVQPTAPETAATVFWSPVGGDVTIADFPLQDFTGGIAPSLGAGLWQIDLTSDVGAPYVFGLRNVEWHLLASAPDVVTEWDGSTATGPQWDRPYYILGVSTLGPVNYKVIEFEVSVSGGYEFTSVVSSGNNFTFLYDGAFDPNQPLDNLLDYGLGNGNAPNGSPQGTSFISVLLHAGQTYYFVNSQWDRFSPGTPYTNTVIGPGTLINVVPPLPCVGDLDGDGDTDVFDFGLFAGSFGSLVPPGTGGDLDGDGDVDVFDFGIFAGHFGCGLN
jgi:hypothetical protein